MMKHVDVQIQESQQTPRKTRPKRTIPKYILVKLLKNKNEKNILKTARGKKDTLQIGD